MPRPGRGRQHAEEDEGGDRREHGEQGEVALHPEHAPRGPQEGDGTSDAGHTGQVRARPRPVRVIAGPVCTRTLALFGADVLRIDPPDLPEPEWQHFDTGLRKFGALLGDQADVGCNAVLNPGSIIGKSALVYPNVCWRGILPDNMIAKNRAPLDVAVRRPRSTDN